MRRDSSETKRKILTVCIRLFLEQGYKSTSVSQIVGEAGVARGSYLNLFPTKDRILLELTETMFGGQFGVARSIADSNLPPVYAYAVETAIQLTLTELNENLREIYIEAYSMPDTSEYIYLHTTAELKQIFGVNFPDDTESDFYEMEIGTAGLMRSYMARKCDIHFPLERKLSRFLTAAMRVYRVPEAEQAKVLAFIQSLDIRAIAALMALSGEPGAAFTLQASASHSHCICGGSVTAGDHTSHSNVTYTAWNGTDGISYTNNTAYVYLTGNATINSNLVVDGTTLYLCLNGKIYVRL